jgi:hypothetical protein
MGSLTEVLTAGETYLLSFGHDFAAMWTFTHIYDYSRKLRSNSNRTAGYISLRAPGGLHALRACESESPLGFGVMALHPV